MISGRSGVSMRLSSSPCLLEMACTVLCACAMLGSAAPLSILRLSSGLHADAARRGSPFMCVSCPILRWSLLTPTTSPSLLLSLNSDCVWLDSNGICAIAYVADLESALLLCSWYRTTGNLKQASLQVPETHPTNSNGEASTTKCTD